MKTASLLIFLAAAAVTTPAIFAAPLKATIAPIVGESREVDTRGSGEVIVHDEDGSLDPWTIDTYCLLPRVSPGGTYVGWTTGKITKTKQNGTTLVNDRLLIARGRDQIIVNIKDPLMIETWAFHPDGKSVIVKSRGFHGPATLYRAAIATGEIIASYPAATDAANLPAWAQAMGDDAGEDRTNDPAPADPATPYTPKTGSPERKAILDALRAEVAADQAREDPNQEYATAVFTPDHFRVLGPWAFVSASMKPDYAENAITAVLQQVNDKWEIKLMSLADDVPDYNFFAEKTGAPRALLPAQIQLGE